MDFGDFTIQVPEGWKELKPETTDSNAGIMITKNKDSVFYDYGPYSNSLEENPVIISRKNLKKMLSEHPETDTTEFFIINDDETASPQDFIRNTITYKKIDRYNAKILEPKQTGKGMTGIYIDSIRSGSLGKIRFNFYGKNLSQESQTELLNAINTIKASR